ncbi:NAD(P)H-hydrate dehydratase [Desulfosarcina ovata]|uniref:Sugar kinase n=2 Tax=Desulfosarcina ovata TaxID=83564 RepID=A0A5K8AA82_9BACT|nr:NAD(P)H-hydrate dehydratase [Desulfosarcina ovata]BBO82274.1 sugar kinase [Desulfosarcina ovata subsp. sediminis]BBO89487.1 sugar kinase [Desulfosarcina ovata subsp. ovata]
MRAVVGTVPSADFPLTVGEVSLSGDAVHIEGQRVSVNRGTPALLAAAVEAMAITGQGPLIGFLVGDIGLGDGSRRLYEFLSHHLDRYDLESITFHYLQPDVDWHNRVLFAVERMSRPPLLIADAGFMYAAKMSGSAPAYDLFTPDVGELAFLADEAAPHPFYTRGFILHDENQVPDLIQRAYAHDNAARNLLVKGSIDRLADRSGVLHAVDRPSVDAMEAMGGTGDTLTGLVTALIGVHDLSIPQAAMAAARINREAGLLANLSPASQVLELIRQLPRAMGSVLENIV